MEKWQKDTITKNLSLLIELTRVSTSVLAKLLSKGILSDEDCTRLESIKSEDNKSHELYNICMTRTSGFEALLEVLSKERQSGAVHVLQNSQKSATRSKETLLPYTKFKHSSVLEGEICNFLDSDFHLLIFSTLDSNLTSERLKTSSNEFIVVKRGANSLSKISTLSELSAITSSDEQETQENQPVSYIAFPKKLFESSNLEILLDQKLILITDEKHEHLQNVVLNHKKSSTIKLAEDEFQWSDLTTSCQKALLAQNIMDQGRFKSLQSFCDQIVYEESQDKHLERFLNAQVLVDMLNGRPPVIYRHTIPPTKFYVQRKIIFRNRLDPNFLNICKSKDDVFFLTGMEKYQLSKLGCKSHFMSKFRHKKLPDTAKHILGTSNQQQDTEFGELCKSSEKNVHWFHGDPRGQILWKRSKGRIGIFQDFISNSHSQTDHVYEDVFLDFLDTHSRLPDPVCICDSPGMGKSVLLASLARRIKKKHESHFVIFVVLTEFMDLLHKKKILQGVSLEEAVLTALSRIVSGNEFGTMAFKSDSRKIELLFDGLDEVAKDKVDLAIQCFKLVPSVLKSVRLFVTTRPNLTKKLEHELNVLSYNIKHFDKEDQIKFLCDHWHEEMLQKLRLSLPFNDSLNLEENFDKEVNMEGTKSFAKTCLEKLKENLKTKEVDIAGIPLQCMLIALVFREDGAYFADPKIQFNKDEALSRINITSIVNLYERLVEKKLEAYEKRTVGKLRRGRLEKTCLTKVHFYLASLLLFPEWASRLRDDLLTPQLHENFVKICSDIKLQNFLRGEFPQNEVQRFGFVEALGDDGRSTHFVHRTFAEYFVAVFVVQELQLPEKARSVSNFNSFLMEAVLETIKSEVTLSRFLQLRTSSTSFKHPVVCHFINSLIGSSNLAPSMNWQISNSEFKAYENDDMFHIFVHLGGESEMKNILQNSDDPHLLSIAVKQSSEEFVSTICNTNPGLCWKNLEDIAELLYIAVERGNFSIFDNIVCLPKVKKYVEDIDLAAKNNLVSGLLSVCLSHSSRDDDETVDDKVQIAKWLLSLFDDLKSAIIIVFAVNFHADLMETLSESGAELDSLSVLLKTDKPPDTLTKEDFVRYMSMVETKEGIQLYI